ISPIPVFATQGTVTPPTITAYFTSPAPGRTPGEFSATINWGDGFSDPATIDFDGSQFRVYATHTYGGSGKFAVTTTVNDPKATTNQTQTVMSLATVSEPAPKPGSVTGGLAPVGSVGNVNGTPVTSNNTPTFSGTVPAFFVVQLMAQQDGQAAPT